MFPGLSRSGSTIFLALLIGVAPARAAKFSFHISVPSILGAALVTLKDGGLTGMYASSVLAAGFLASMVTGYIALAVVERLVVRGRFHYFAPYTALLAGICFYLHVAF